MANEINAVDIGKKLQSKGADKECPRCGKFKFSIAGHGVILIQNDPNVFSIGGGPSIPTIIIICETCGYVMQHAKGTLGLMDGMQ